MGKKATINQISRTFKGGIGIKPLIKWPGGKSGEIGKIEKMIPSHARYIEPFFGGGALFFHLEPRKAIINDRSAPLMDFYTLIKNRDRALYNLLSLYHSSFSSLMKSCEERYADIFSIYLKASDAEKPETGLQQLVESLAESEDKSFDYELILNIDEYIAYLCKFSADKMNRTKAHNQKHSFSEADLKENLVTVF